MSIILVILLIVFAFVMGTIFGAGIVVGRIRKYRDEVITSWDHISGPTEASIRAVIGDLLTWLGK